MTIARRLDISADDAADRYHDIRTRIPDVFQGIAQEIDETGRNADVAHHIADTVSAQASGRRDRFGDLILSRSVQNRPVG